MHGRHIDSIGDAFRFQNRSQNQSPAFAISPLPLQHFLNGREVPGHAIDLPIITIRYPGQDRLLNSYRVRRKIIEHDLDGAGINT
jgi:hypothetical protein